MRVSGITDASSANILDPRLLVDFQLATSAPEQILDSSEVLLVDCQVLVKLSSCTWSARQYANSPVQTLPCEVLEMFTRLLLPVNPVVSLQADGRSSQLASGSRLSNIVDTETKHLFATQSASPLLLMIR